MSGSSQDDFKPGAHPLPALHGSDVPFDKANHRDEKNRDEHEQRKKFQTIQEDRLPDGGAPMGMTKEQLASLDRHAKRFVARHGYGDEPLPLYIRVAESRIYHGKPMHKALLKEVIFMRMRDLHENDTRIPKGTPWSKDYTKYEGWTYTSQKYLANRVGSKDQSYVGEVLRQIEEDGFLRSRSYPIKGKGFRRRKQYFALEEAIDAKIAELGVIEDEDESDDNPDGSDHKGLTTTAIVVKPPSPQGLNHHDAVVKPLRPYGLNHKELGSSVALSETVDLVRSFSTPPAPSATGEVKTKNPTSTSKTKPNPAQAQGSQAKTPKTKATATAASVSPTPRRGIVGFDGEPVGFDLEEA
jgi:hypothetical protein